MRGESKNDASSNEKRQRAKYVWRCELCDRCLCSKRSYMEHKNTHVAARPFKCEFCDYAAASQMTLRRHTLRQHVPRSHWHYPCPYCEQAFVEPTSYQAHLRHKHVGYSGTYGCDVCEYRTLSSKNFADHTIKHLDDRPRKFNSGVIKDYANKKFINRYLIEDELGVGWGQRPESVVISEQFSSLRRVAKLEQDRTRKDNSSMPASSRSTIRRTAQSTTSVASISIPEYSKKSIGISVAAAPVLASNDPGCSVPDPECYVEVETATEFENPVSSTVGGIAMMDSSSDESSENEVDLDDDSVSCSSDSNLEIDLRLTKLTADIDQRVMSQDSDLDLDDDISGQCQDLGNDILPDGQVDFDLD